MKPHLLDGLWDGPVYRVSLPGMVISLVAGVGTDLDLLDNVDVEARLDDDTVWTATVFTIAEVERLMDRWAAGGGSSDSRYLACPDALIVRSPGVTEIIAALQELRAHGELSTILRQI